MEPTKIQPLPLQITPWTATITGVSDVDSSGSMSVSFDVVATDGTTYPNLSVQGDPTNIDDSIKAIMINLKSSVEQASVIQVGQEITL